MWKLGIVSAVALCAPALFMLESALPQAAPAAAAVADRALLEDLVYANRILYDQGVLDGFGHVSVRDPKNPDHFLLARSMAPAQVTTGDILEYDRDGEPIHAGGQRVYLERLEALISPPTAPAAPPGAGGPPQAPPGPFLAAPNVPRSDFPALARAQVRAIRDQARAAALTAPAGSVARAHWQDIVDRTDKILDPGR